MGAYHRVLTLALAAASVSAVAASQSNVGAVNLVINGSTAVSGVAILDSARQILFTFAGDEHLHTYTVTGTNVSGVTQSEVVTGTNGGTAVTTLYYKTVTQIAASATSTSTIQVGTNGVGATVPMIIDRFISATNITAAVVTSGTINYSVQISYDDLAPAWDTVATPPTWFSPVAFAQQSATTAGLIPMPITMVRLLQNSFSTGGGAALTINVPLGFVG